MRDPADPDRSSPAALERVDDAHISIKWGDGVTSIMSMSKIRSRCTCAHCVDEITGVPLIRWRDVVDVRIESMEQVGLYAFSIVFSDGHESGIFPYRLLREIADE